MERPLTVDELLSLGEQFLLDGNYEQALVQFLQTIEVEPMNPRGYTGAAEAYVGLGQHDRAREVLEEGQRVVGDDAGIRGLLDDFVRAEEERRQAEIEAEEAQRLAEIEAEEERRQAEIEAEIRQGLEELLAEYEANGYENLNDMYMDSGRLRVRGLLHNQGEFPHILLNDAGDHGIGIYRGYVGGGFGEFMYIGGFSNNQRSGHGTWIWTGTGTGGYRFVGEWSNDMPNGTGTLYMHEVFKEGTLVNGLWHGITTRHAPYPHQTFLSINFEHGRAIPIGEHNTVATYGGWYVRWLDTMMNTLYGVIPFAEESFW